MCKRAAILGDLDIWIWYLWEILEPIPYGLRGTTVLWTRNGLKRKYSSNYQSCSNKNLRKETKPGGCESEASLSYKVSYVPAWNP